MRKMIDRRVLCDRRMTSAAPEALPMFMNWGQIFSLLNEICWHGVAALQDLKLYATRVKDVKELSKMPI